ncbi:MULTISPECIES: Spy/CpxP family protein refolding chaperone [Algibacter]|uniref:Spy/CpxP family protein refolding chaperone n=1 Tax=Algibacter TaxID=261827 RepID=UPI00131ACA8E|nr:MULTISPECIES: sensor of ECF-type sigma factor [Algibacter]MDO7137674.1 sensor of ECF-type sigma factor [Algibacter lectus]
MKTYISTLFVLLFTVSVFAQHKDRERIQALKVSFITEKLDLTAKEAQAFWPIYNAYDEKSRKCKYEDMRGIRKEIKENAATLTDAKAEELLNKFVQAENTLHQERVNLIVNLKKIISPKKIILLKATEDDFNRKLFDEYKKRKREGKTE